MNKVKSATSGKRKYKKFLVPSVVIMSMLVIAVLTTSSVFAQDASNYPPIVQRLAERFNLNEEEVVKVFNEVKDERHAEMYAMWADKLDDAVLEGKITVEQKELILEKHEEMQEKLQNLQGLSLEDRKAEMEKLHEEMRSWAEENDLNFRQFKPLGMGKRMHGFRHAGYVSGIIN